MEKNSTIKKLKRNIISGFFSQLLLMAMGIIVPRLVLVSFGSEVNGFLNSISQIFTCMEVLEAGVGTATLQALFQYTGNGNKDKMNAVLSATTIFYNRIGRIYLLLLVGIAVIYPIFVTSSIGFGTMFLVILMQGIPGAISYFVQAKFRILLSADGRTYVQNNVLLITRILSNIAKILLILRGYNVLSVQFAFFLIQMGQVLVYKLYEQKKYHWVNYHEQPDFNAIAQKKNVFIHQISGLIFSNTDLLVLTAFCDLKVVSVYSVYSMILSMVSNIINTVASSIYFVLGQVFNQDRKRYIILHDLYETYYMGFVFAMYTVTYILIIPFLKIYTRGVTDISYLDKNLPALFVLIHFLQVGRAASLNVLNFSQMFKETMHHAIIEMLLNIIVSLVGAYYYGIYGVLAGTIVALLYRGNVMIYYANKKVLHRSCWITYRRWFVCFCIFILSTIVASVKSFSVSGYFSFFLHAIPISITVCITYFVVLSMVERDVFRYLEQWVLVRRTTK